VMDLGRSTRAIGSRRCARGARLARRSRTGLVDVHRDRPCPLTESALTPTSSEVSGPAAISRAVVRIHSEYYGRGPTRARTALGNGVITVVLEGLFTPAERTLVAAGRFELVRATRIAFQDDVEPLLRHGVEEITGMPVVGFLSQIALNDLGAEVFVLVQPPSSA
jgi:uncharacterized protein YbcI